MNDFRRSESKKKWYQYIHTGERWNKRKQQNEKYSISVEMGAEYRYVPHSAIVAPSPVQNGDLRYPLSLSSPVPGGFSGTIEFDLIADTPVLFGQAGRVVRIEGEDKDRKITEHVRLYEGGPYAAPGRAIKGMIRNVLGTAAFSHFRPINGEHRPVSRNMEYISKFANRAPRDKNTPPSAGWLQLSFLDNELVWRIIPAKAFFIESQLIGGITNLSSAVRRLDEAKDNEGHIKAVQRSIGAKTKAFSLEHADVGEYSVFSGKELVDFWTEFRTLWNELSFEEKSVILDCLPKQEGDDSVEFYRPLGEKKPVYISGPKATHHLVAAGAMSTRLHELLLAFPAENAGEVVADDIVNDFLWANSNYASDGVILTKRGTARRKPSKQLLHLLADYLKNHKQRHRIAKLLGLSQGENETSIDRDIRELVLRHNAPVPGVPVYLEPLNDGKGYHLGLSQVIPVPAGGAVEDFVHQSPLPTGQLDWADALFGFVVDASKKSKANEDENVPENEEARHKAQASRLNFHFAKARMAGEAKDVDADPARLDLLPNNKTIALVQGQPKISFDPLTLSRADAAKGPIGWAVPPAMGRVNGYRRYPAARFYDASIEQATLTLVDGILSRTLDNNTEIGRSHSLSRPLKAGVIYACRIDFSNLHPLELGALLWAITFGDRRTLAGELGGTTSYRHVGGRLRNKGLGRLRPASVRLAGIEENPMPEKLAWEECVVPGADPEVELAKALMEAFEVRMGRYASDAAEEIDETDSATRQYLREAFYDTDTITALLNISDANWDGTSEGHDLFDMFRLPTPTSEDDKDYFGNFSNLRRLIYRERVLPRIGAKTVLDEFLKPDQSPPEAQSDAPADPADCRSLRFCAPLAALDAWRQRK